MQGRKGMLGRKEEGGGQMIAIERILRSSTDKMKIQGRMWRSGGDNTQDTKQVTTKVQHREATVETW